MDALKKSLEKELEAKRRVKMHLTETYIEHLDNYWKIEFIGDDGDVVTVQVAGDDDLDEVDVVDRARGIMVQLTAFGTRGGGKSVDKYDAASTRNFDADEPNLGTQH
jgi:hypothetical protein